MVLILRLSITICLVVAIIVDSAAARACLWCEAEGGGGMARR